MYINININNYLTLIIFLHLINKKYTKKKKSYLLNIFYIIIFYIICKNVINNLQYF